MAVSGGSDSVALVWLLADLASRGELELAGIAHLNHHIRGSESDDDAAFCRALASRLGLPIASGDADVPAEAKRDGVSLEVAGRNARQKFFQEVLSSLRATRVALGHTRDDQAETVLLRLARGAGAGGLAGMAPRRGPLVRPVLETTREELREFLRARGETWREDRTNLDRAIPRNLIRHDVMPVLRQLNPQADAALARAAEALRLDAELLETLANAAFMRCVKTETGKVQIDAGELTRLPRPVATRVARYALETANPARSYGLEEAQAVCSFAAGGEGAELAGLVMERFGATVVLSTRQAHQGQRAPAVDPFELKLNLPGTVEAPFGTWTVTAEGPMPASTITDSGAARVMVDASDLGSHLIVRPRRPGDRLHPLGAPGRRKVQDVLVDRKVPRDDRDRIPIVTTETGQIVWVAGQVLAEPFRVTPLTKSVVVLTLRRT